MEDHQTSLVSVRLPADLLAKLGELADADSKKTGVPVSRNAFIVRALREAAAKA